MSISCHILTKFLFNCYIFACLSLCCGCLITFFFCELLCVLVLKYLLRPLIRTLLHPSPLSLHLTGPDCQIFSHLNLMVLIELCSCQGENYLCKTYTFSCVDTLHLLYPNRISYYGFLSAKRSDCGTTGINAKNL